MNTELHQRTVETLSKLVDVLDCDELSLLCWHCGVSVTELMPSIILNASQENHYAIQG